MPSKFKAAATIFFKGDGTQYTAMVNRLQAQAHRDGETIAKNLNRGLGLAAGAAFAVKQFADFEQGLSGVRKTTGLVGAELTAFGERIKVMAQDSVFGTDALLATAQAAAQLGVSGTDNILAYTDAITKLAAASDFSPEEAAFALARLSEIAGLGADQVDNLAATFTALGNNVATTEKELNEAAISIASAGSSYGVTAAQALGMAAAFASIGQASFANGTAVGNFFKQLGKATREGGDQLNAFAEVMGVSTSEVIRLFREDAAGAFKIYLEGLQGLGAEADVLLEQTGILEAKAQRQFKSLGSSIGNTLKVAQKGFIEGTAHIEEYEGMTDNLISSLKTLMNSLNLVAIGFGETLNPSIREAADNTRAFVNTNRTGIVATLEALGRLASAYIAVRLAVSALRLGLSKFLLMLAAVKKGTFLVTAGLTTLKLVAGGAFTALLFFLPEISKFLVKTIPNAIDVVIYKFRSWGNVVEKFFRESIDGFLKFGRAFAMGADKLAEISNRVFGTELSTSNAEYFTNMVNANAEAIEQIDKDNARLEKLTKIRLRDMGEAWGTFKKEVGSASAELFNIQFDQSGANVPVIPQAQSGLGTGGRSNAPAKTAEEIKAEEEEAAKVAEEARIKAQNEAWSRERHRVAMEQAARTRLESQAAEDRERMNAEARHRVASEEAARTRMEADAEDARERDRVQARHRAAMELAAQTRMQAQADAEHRQVMLEHESETELEIYRMKLEGIEEADIAHYERMQELEAEILAARHAKDDAELERLLRAQQIELAAWKKKEREKTMTTIAEGSRAMKAMNKQHTALAKALTAAQKAEALYNLAVKGPSLAAEAFGRAQAAFPPPFGQALGAAAYAAVIAKMTAAVTAVEGAKYALGGVVPGYGITDSQRALLTPGETITPVKNYGDVEDGIRTRMRREEGLGMGDDYSYDESPRVAVDLNLSEEAARLISVQSDAAEAQRV